jgi:wobble nucleotide-excising tRNase
MLRKIIAVRNVGRFRNSAAAGNPQLARHTLISGANGFGKTTLCAILRSLQSGDPAHVLGRATLGAEEAPSIELLFPAGTIRFDGGAWTSLVPDLAIFDGVFVAENVHSGEVVEIDHRRNLYRVIIGQEGVRLAEQDTALATTSREMTGAVTAARNALMPHMPQGMRIEAFLATELGPNIEAEITAQETVVAASREAGAIQARAALSAFPIPAMPEGVAAILARTLDDVAPDAEQLLAGHIARHGMAEQGEPWIAQGLRHTEDSCPFCGQDVHGLPLIAAYRAIFSEQFRTLSREIGTLRQQIMQAFGDRALGSIATIADQNRENLTFWQRFIAFDEVSITPPEGFTAAAEALRDAALALVDRKAASPLAALIPDAAFTEAQAAFAETIGQFDPLNQQIAAINVKVAETKAATGAADVQAEEATLARLKLTRTRHLPDVVTLCDAYNARIEEKSDVDRRKEEVRQQLEAHMNNIVQPYEYRINELLGNFNAGFTISQTRHTFPGGIATSSYRLVINNVNVDLGDGRTSTDLPSFKNTLSAGDRSTLALAFFLAHLEHDPNRAQKIVVFDDPFSSQDAFRRRQTVHEIMAVARDCAQVIVLSHDATFLKQVWDKAPHDSRIAVGIADHRAQGSKMSAIDLERICQGRTATDIDDLQAFMSTGAGGLLDLVRKCRVVLETYCKTTYPASFATNDWLGDIVGKIRAGGDQHPAHALYDELDQINGYTSQYHHGEDVGDLTPDQIDSNELTGFARRTLRVVNALQA